MGGNMHIDQRILEVFGPLAQQATIDELHLGLGYSAVTLTDGRCGLCCTLSNHTAHCNVFKEPDYEGRQATVLLERILSPDTLGRVAAIALTNALNQPVAMTYPEDNGDDLEADLALSPGMSVAMLGNFAPVVAHLRQAGITVNVLDIGKREGNEDDFYSWARSGADVVILSATSVVMGNTERTFELLGYKKVPTVVLGPSAILCKEIYSHLPVTMVAGTVPLDTKAILKAIRNGRGTPHLHKHAKKVKLLF
jgi:uncharacterized protein (DUF4213/DUF364 family)